jgi:hypothetical protein
VFGALKYVAKPDEVTNTKALRISFKTEKPHYPYKMPSDAFRPGWVRPLNLYFIASSGVDAQFLQTGDKWQGQQEWSGSLKSGVATEVAGLVKLNASELPEDPILTVFKNASDETKYDDDLVFAATSSLGTWIWGGFAVVMIGAWLLTQRNRRRSIAAPA